MAGVGEVETDRGDDLASAKPWAVQRLCIPQYIDTVRVVRCRWVDHRNVPGMKSVNASIQLSIV